MGSLNNLAYSKRLFFLPIFMLVVPTFLVVARTYGENKVVASMHKYQHLFELDDNGYPKWFSTHDRMLLSQLQEGDLVQPNVIVAKDGSGQFTTVTEAINSYPDNYQGRYNIYVKAGIYEEYITIDKSKNNIFLYGDGPTNTKITGSRNQHQGLLSTQTATFSTFGEDFTAMSIAFENTAGPEGESAIALLVEGDRSSFFNCAFLGYQDTLCVSKNRQFYRNCEIYGTIDFIFGESTTLIQNSKILVRKPYKKQYNVIVADGTYQSMSPTGIVIQNCFIMPDPELLPFLSTVKTYLARPWKAYSRVVFINNYIDDFIQRDGFIIWHYDTPNTENSYFAEYGNSGPGADTTSRVKWAKGLITQDEAARFIADSWLDASTWLPFTNIPYDSCF